MTHQENKKHAADVAHKPTSVMYDQGPRFSLGRTLITPAAQAQLDAEDIYACLKRHERGDWGECSDADKTENDFLLTRHLRLFSAYRDRKGTKFWIVTEADRSATTVLMPDDY